MLRKEKQKKLIYAILESQQTSHINIVDTVNSCLPQSFDEGGINQLVDSSLVNPWICIELGSNDCYAHQHSIIGDCAL